MRSWRWWKVLLLVDVGRVEMGRRRRADGNMPLRLGVCIFVVLSMCIVEGKQSLKLYHYQLMMLSMAMLEW